MIDSLNGEILTIGLDHAVIECSGVGYRFLAPPPTLSQLTKGQIYRVLTSMVVKDDGVTLYGFSDDDARAMFHKLQAVSGLGPKLALAALSVFDAAELAAKISAGDAKAVQAVPGVGKKMAERIVLELRDKVDGIYGSAPEADAAGAAVGSAATAATEQVVEALVGLGFGEKVARPVVEQRVAQFPDEPTSDLLRSALTQLGNQ